MFSFMSILCRGGLRMKFDLWYLVCSDILILQLLDIPSSHTHLPVHQWMPEPRITQSAPNFTFFVSCDSFFFHFWLFCFLPNDLVMDGRAKSPYDWESLSLSNVLLEPRILTSLHRNNIYTHIIYTFKIVLNFYFFLITNLGIFKNFNPVAIIYFISSPYCMNYSSPFFILKQITLGSTDDYLESD